MRLTPERKDYFMWLVNDHDPNGAHTMGFDHCWYCGHIELLAEIDALRNEKKEIFRNGVAAGLRAFSWMKDGVSYVGSCGTTLKEALERLDKDDLFL